MAQFDANRENVPLDDFLEFTGLKFDQRDFRLTDEIARGGYGVVHGAIRISTGEELALKFFGYTRNQPRVKWIIKEIQLMAKAKACPNAVQIIGVFYDTEDGILPRKIHKRKYPVIVMEKLKGEDIFYRIINAGRFSERNASSIFASFIEAVHYLHTNSQIINCDLKAENVVFQSTVPDDFSIKIIDFGTALSLPEDADYIFDGVKRGTESLIAPETCNLYNKFRAFIYSKQTDIWQAGCFLYILLLASLPFGEGEEAERRISDANPTLRHLPQYFFTHVSPDAQDLVLRMLDKNPASRISTAEILRHRWVKYNDRVSNEDLGVEYRTRVRSWAYCKQLKRVLADKITAGFERKLLLENVMLSAQGIVRPAEDDLDEQAMTVDMQVQKPELEDVQRPALPEDVSITISPAQFLFLQQTFVDCCRELNTREVTLETFAHIVSQVGLPVFASAEVFKIFDQDGSLTVDYFEFLLTLIPFRTDAKDGDLARLYFEVFDVDGNRSISQEELQWILSKLLMEPEGSTVISSTAMIYQQAVFEANNFDDIFKCIDTNGDGVISFEEFDMFFKVMNSKTTYHHTVMRTGSKMEQ